MARKKPACIWYIEPLNSDTNSVIGHVLCGHTDANEQVPCADGNVRDLWQCNHAFVARCYRDKNHLCLQFCVWRKIGNGLPAKWEFDDPFFQKRLRERKNQEHLIKAPLLF